MRVQFFMRPAIPLAIAGAAMITGCVDNDYDLSDIESTAELKFNDLVLPINIEEINLEEIINLADDSRVKVVNGEYVVVENGTYTSDVISIPQINVDAPEIEPIGISLNPTAAVAAKSLSQDAVFPIGTHVQDFTYREGNVSGFIIDVDKVKAGFNINIRLAVSGIDASTGAVSLRDLVLQLPKGLTGVPEMGIYNAETGEVVIGDKVLTSQELSFNMPVSEVDLVKANADYDYTRHVFVFTDVLGVKGGDVVASLAGLSSVPASIDFVITPSMSDMKITAFTGTVEYSIEGIDLDPIEMTDIPTILSQNVTNLSLVNPQIYLSFNNPMAQYQLTAQTGLTITANRVDAPSKTFSLDEDFTAGYNKGEGPYQYCVSPQVPETYYEGYSDAEHVLFSTLGEVLSGDGLPSSLDVTFVNPRIARHPVTDFVLGDNLGQVTGDYTFFAPLALKAGSQIVYSSTEKGWSDEELDAMVIKTLKIDATITNNIPVDIAISAYPIDVEGNRIGDVEIVGADVTAGAVDQALSIYITGEVTRLDGITFEAVAEADGSGESLKPSQTIILKNIKVTASGSYIKEL